MNLDALSTNNPFLTVMIGDFNVKSSNWYLKNITSFEGSQIQFFASEFAMSQVIKEPTYILDNSKSGMDLIFKSQPNMIIDSGVHLSLHSNLHHQKIVWLTYQHQVLLATVKANSKREKDHAYLLFFIIGYGMTVLLLNCVKKEMSVDIINILRDFLRNRKQRVVLNGQCSSWVDVCAGVPHWSLLGYLLFLLYTGDLSDDLKGECKLFADDTSLFHVVHSINTSASDLNGTSRKWVTGLFNGKLILTQTLISNLQKLYVIGRKLTHYTHW